MPVQALKLQAAAESSAVCMAISQVLDSMGVQHQRNVLSPGGFLLAKILLPDGSALLIEGPKCYACNTGQRRGALCGPAMFTQEQCLTAEE